MIKKAILKLGKLITSVPVLSAILIIVIPVISYAIITPTPPTYTEAFDGVVAPALPANWSTAGGWVTSDVSENNFPNCALNSVSGDLVTDVFDFTGLNLTAFDFYIRGTATTNATLKVQYKIGAGAWIDLTNTISWPVDSVWKLASVTGMTINGGAFAAINGEASVTFQFVAVRVAGTSNRIDGNIIWTVEAGGPGDEIAPAGISSLSALTTASNDGEVALKWMAPGDDGTGGGNATSYVIKYATFCIDSTADYSGASTYQYPPAPGTFGTEQTFTCTSLANGTTYWFAIKAKDESNTGIWPGSYGFGAYTGGTIADINCYYAKGAPDTKPPCAISNLTAITGGTSGTVQLKWTAPGDDGTGGGNVSEYLVKSATFPITSALFDGCSTYAAASSWTPGTAGQEETGRVISGLTAGTTYWFAVKATDDSSNQGMWPGSLSHYSSGNPSQDSNAAVATPISVASLPWTENFTGYADGTQTGTDDKWTTDVTACTFSDVDDYFEVRSEKFAVCDTDGEGIWTTETLGVSGYVAVTVAFDLDYDFTTGTNYFRVYYDIGAGDVLLYEVTDGSGTPSLNLDIPDSGTLSASTLVLTIKSSIQYGTRWAIWDNMVITGVPPDTISPCAISNLTAIAGSSDGEVDLKWTAPGDDGTTGGNATSYEIKYALYEITPANYAVVSDTYPYPPAPGAAGSEQTFTLTSLSPGVAYWFAIKATDEQSNSGAWPTLARYQGDTAGNKAVVTGELEPPIAANDFELEQSTDPLWLGYTISTAGCSIGAGDYFIRTQTHSALGGNWSFAACDIDANDTSARLTFNSVDISSYTNVKVRVWFKCADTGYELADSVRCWVREDGIDKSYFINFINTDLKNSLNHSYREFTYNVTPDGVGKVNSIQLIYEVGDAMSADGNGFDEDDEKCWLDNVSITGDIRVPDETPPADILNLTALTGDFEGRVNLKWTAPGNDGDAGGNCAGYLVRYSTSKITEDDWDASTPYLQAWQGGTAGEEKTETIKNLIAGVTYWFAVNAYDVSSNTSTWQGDLDQYDLYLWNATCASTVTAWANHVVISEVYAKNPTDFVELYNPTNEPVSLNGWKLDVYGGDYTFQPEDVIPAHRYFIVANVDPVFGIEPDVHQPTLAMTENGVNSFAKLIDDSEQTVDVVGWEGAVGGNYEGTKLKTLPDDNSWERKSKLDDITAYLSSGGESENSGNGHDMDDNYNDFVAQSEPNPQNRRSPAEPTTGIPDLITEDASDILNTSADINCSFTMGFAPEVEVYFKWQKEGDSSWQEMTHHTSTSAATYSVTLTDLILGSTYYFNVELIYSTDTLNFNTITDSTKTFTTGWEPPEILPKTVVINEIAYMGTGASDSHQWFEFYNTTDAEIDIANWSMYGADAGLTLEFNDEDNVIKNTKIPALGYLIYANGEDNIKDIVGENMVDISDATIEPTETSGHLILYDENKTKIDEVVDSDGSWWSPISAGYSVERKDPDCEGTLSENWAICLTQGPETDSGGTPLNGTPGRENSVYSVLDPTPPAAIALLTVSALAAGNPADEGKVQIKWAAPGDDGTTGSNSSGYYEIRYSTAEPYAGWWNAITGKTDYRGIVKFGSPLSPGETETKIITRMLLNTTFYLCVRTYDDVLNISNIATYAEIFVPDTSPPVPEAAETSWRRTAVNVVTVYWEAGPFDTNYYCIEKTTYPSIDYLPVGSTTSYSWTSADLTENNTYVYRISAVDYSGHSSTDTAAEWLEITVYDDTTTPTVPVLGSPADGISTNQTTITFDWENSTDDNSGVKNYDLCISTDISFAHIVSTTSSTASQQQVNISTAGLYYWKVRVWDNRGNDTWSSSYRSLTIDFVIPAPISNLTALTTLINGGVRLKWTAPGDDGEGGGNCSGYVVKYNTTKITSETDWDNATEFTQSWSGGTSESEKTGIVYGLSGGVTYWFAIKAYDDASNSSVWPGTLSQYSSGDPSQDSNANFAFLAEGAWSDDFSDGDFTLSPSWGGDPASWRINDSNELQLGAPAAEQWEYLSTESSAADGEWIFYFKYNGDPSDTNKMRVHLMSDAANLEGNLSGYFITIGQTGEDYLKVYRQTVSDTTLLKDTGFGDGLSITGITVKVTRSASTWELFADSGKLTNAVTSRAAWTENTYSTSSYFGVSVKHTAGYSDKWYFDNFFVASIASDVTPPAAILNLAATRGAQHRCVDLTWTAPGDDESILNNVGGSYAVRFATYSVNSDTATWWNANSSNEKTFTGVKNLGQTESRTVDGLTAGATYYFAVKSYDSGGNESEIDVLSLSQATQARAYAYKAAPDALDPSSITDLVATTGNSAGMITVKWTAPGQDGTTGTSTGYLVKYAETKITAANFNNKSTYSQSWTPKASGQAEEYTLSGLSSGLLYYIAIKAYDNNPPDYGGANYGDWTSAFYSDDKNSAFSGSLSRKVVINEIAYAGTSASASQEWFELYNRTDDVIDITNWSIYGADAGVILNFSDADGNSSTVLQPHSYLIYANNENDVNDSSGTVIVDIWDKTIDPTSTSDMLILYDGPAGTGSKIDEVDDNNGSWFVSLSANYSMERKDPAGNGTNSGNWAVCKTTGPELHSGGTPLNGTPKRQNSVYEDLSSDVVAPSAVTDLSADAGTYNGEITLAWTASGNNGTSGDNTGGYYRLRFTTYSVGDFTEDATAWWQSGISGEEKISATAGAGERETATLENLTAGTTYYFAMKTYDSSNNVSPIDDNAYSSATQANAPASDAGLPPELPRTVVINEVAYLGTEASDSDEWIELYNTTDADIDISGWSIYGAKAGTLINFSDKDGGTTVISSGSFLIYANHIDDVKSSTGNIVNIWDATIDLTSTSDRLILYDGISGTGNKIDEVDDGDGSWFVSLSKGYSMERKDPTYDGMSSANWAVCTTQGPEADSGGNELIGTPGRKNSVYTVFDSTPPAAINDLSALYGTKHGRVNLSWSAPGDDGAEGNNNGGYYVVRFAKNSVASDPASWWSENSSNQKTFTDVKGIGQKERRTVDGLTAGDTYYFAVKTYDSSGNVSVMDTLSLSSTAQARAFAYKAEPDTATPCGITDLTASSGLGSGAIIIKWTAPGDDGTAGTAEGYLVKYAETKITSDNFNSAASYTQSWSPKLSGEPEEYTLAGLSPGTLYYIAIKAYDDNPDDYDGANYGPWPVIAYGNDKNMAESGCISRDVVINEIAYAGTAASASHEWFELHNRTAGDIDIADWSIYGADANVLLNFSDADGESTTVIPAGGYLIYANNQTDVKDVSGTALVDIWDKTLDPTATSDSLILYDGPSGTGNKIDEVDNDDGSWFVTVSAGYSMERKDPAGNGTNPDNWAVCATQGPETDSAGTQLHGTPKRQNSVYEVLPPDTTPPSAVTNLTALTGTYGGEITLTWAAPGDDGTSGNNTGGYYRLRFATYSVGDFSNDATAWWQSGISGEEKVAVKAGAGGGETVTVKGLTPGTTYYFAIKAYDSGNNSSPVDSNAYSSAAQANAHASTAEPAPELARTVVINEVAYLGTESSNSDEWIELYNTTSADIDISGWSIYGAKAGALLNFSDKDNGITVVPAGGFLIYANHTDDVRYANGDIVDIWDATVDLTSSGDLLILYDGQNGSGNKIDEVDDGNGAWFVSISAGYSMERIDPTYDGTSSDNWAVCTTAGPETDAGGNELHGTPGRENSVRGYIDPVAPGAVTDLAVTQGDDDCSVNLSWTAPGDDGTKGNNTLGYYEIAYSTQTVTTLDAWWNGIMQDEGYQGFILASSPSGLGAKETKGVTTLYPGSTFYFCVKVFDKAENYSEITSSCSVWLEDVPPPVPAPAAPSWLRSSSTTASVYWKPGPFDVDHYDVERSTMTDDTGVFDSVGSTDALSWTDVTLSTGDYSYKITAVDCFPQSSTGALKITVYDDYELPVVWYKGSSSTVNFPAEVCMLGNEMKFFLQVVDNIQVSEPPKIYCIRNGVTVSTFVFAGSGVGSAVFGGTVTIPADFISGGDFYYYIEYTDRGRWARTDNISVSVSRYKIFDWAGGETVSVPDGNDLDGETSIFLGGVKGGTATVKSIKIYQYAPAAMPAGSSGERVDVSVNSALPVIGYALSPLDSSGWPVDVAFTESVKITLLYLERNGTVFLEDGTDSGATEGSLKAYFYDARQACWRYAGGTRNADNTLTFNFPHLSSFAIFAAETSGIKPVQRFLSFRTPVDFANAEEVMIYDVRGRKVVKLITSSASSDPIIWYGCDSERKPGSPSSMVESGAYIYESKGAGKKQTGVIVVVK
ncbi:MAG: lamin tail domain-containing protein [bacterium]